MRVELHTNATTTPRTRAYIQESRASVAELAVELGVSETTIRRWRGRLQVHDRSHVRHHLGQSTSAEDEALITVPRQELRLSLNDILEVMRRAAKPELPRSALARCLKRLGLNVLPAVPDGGATAEKTSSTPMPSATRSSANSSAATTEQGSDASTTKPQSRLSTI